jgi:predicted AAA+ superfamily ATPase
MIAAKVPVCMGRDLLSRLLLRAQGFAALRGVLDSSASRDFLALLELLVAERTDPMAVAGAFGQLWEGLSLERDPLLPDAWQSHLVGRLLYAENPFSLGADRGELSPALVEQARLDLRALREFFDLEAETLLGMVEDAAPGLEGVWVPLRSSVRTDETSPRHAVARKLAATEDWGDCVGLLADHFARHGAGRFGRYRAFRWRGSALQAVLEPDPVCLAELVAYEREREPLLRNTERFLAGLPAHHALLYGPPGTGKSSTVKALLNEYADRGLRLVEVAKEDLGALPRVLEILRDRGPRFVLFVDDLSFEEHEVEYKSLKALLEGSVEEPPENVRVYATSNRRNLVRERFSEREDDVHARDTVEERLSLAARFGLRLTFPTPDQGRYLEIVTGLARQRGIKIAEKVLIERAILWDRWHAGRSGRTARQFVNELEAELADPTNLSS